MLVRMIRRRSIVETTDVNEVRKAAFSERDGSPDLNVSTYETEIDRLVQLRTEHCAGASNDRPSGFGHLDVSGLRDGVSTAGNDWFEYSNSAHRELKFADESELLAYIATVLAANCNCHDIETARCKAYLRDHADDPEWQRYFRDHPNGAAWLAMAKKK